MPRVNVYAGAYLDRVAHLRGDAAWLAARRDDPRSRYGARARAAYLDLLSEDQLPQNSDAVLVLGQYRAALNSFEARHKKTINYTET